MGNFINRTLTTDVSFILLFLVFIVAIRPRTLHEFYVDLALFSGGWFFTYLIKHSVRL
jgi:hypothetical protein